MCDSVWQMSITANLDGGRCVRCRSYITGWITGTYMLSATSITSWVSADSLAARPTAASAPNRLRTCCNSVMGALASALTDKSALINSWWSGSAAEACVSRLPSCGSGAAGGDCRPAALGISLRSKRDDWEGLCSSLTWVGDAAFVNEACRGSLMLDRFAGAVGLCCSGLAVRLGFGIWGCVSPAGTDPALLWLRPKVGDLLTAHDPGVCPKPAPDSTAARFLFCGLSGRRGPCKGALPSI